jgi:hypothetical protein
MAPPFGSFSCAIIVLSAGARGPFPLSTLTRRLGLTRAGRRLLPIFPPLARSECSLAVKVASPVATLGRRWRINPKHNSIEREHSRDGNNRDCDEHISPKVVGSYERVTTLQTQCRTYGTAIVSIRGIRKRLPAASQGCAPSRSGAVARQFRPAMGVAKRFDKNSPVPDAHRTHRRLAFALEDVAPPVGRWQVQGMATTRSPSNAAASLSWTSIPIGSASK